MSGSIPPDVVLRPRLGPAVSARRQRKTVGSDVFVYFDVRSTLTGEPVAGVTGPVGTYWIDATEGDDSPSQPASLVEYLPAILRMQVLGTTPGTYTAKGEIATPSAQAATITFEVQGDGTVEFVGTSQIPWNDVLSVGAGAGAAAGRAEGRVAGAEAAPAAAIEAIQPLIAAVDADATAVEISRAQVATNTGLVAQDRATVVTARADVATDRGVVATDRGLAQTARTGADTAAAAALAAQAATESLILRPVAAIVTINTPYNLATYDGYTPVAGDRIGFFGQTAAVNNGIYVYRGGGLAALRASDFALTKPFYAGATVQVLNGARAATVWRLTNSGVTGTDSPAFVYGNEISTSLIKTTIGGGTYLPTLSEIADGNVSIKRFATLSDVTAVAAAMPNLPKGLKITVDPAVSWKAGPMDITADGVTIEGGDTRAIIDARDDFQPYLFKHTGSGARTIRNISLRGAVTTGGAGAAALVGIIVDGPRLISDGVKTLGFRGGYDIWDSNSSRIINWTIEDHRDFGIRLGEVTDNHADGIERNASENFFFNGEAYTHISAVADLSGNLIKFGPKASANYIGQIRGGGHEVAYLFSDNGLVGYRTGHVFMHDCISGFCRKAGVHFAGAQSLYVRFTACSFAADGGAGILVDGALVSFDMLGGSLHRSRTGLLVNAGTEFSRYRLTGVGVQSNTKRDGTGDLGLGVGIEMAGGAGNLEINGVYSGDRKDFPDQTGATRQKYGLVKRAAFTGTIMASGCNFSDNGTAETLIEGANPFINRDGSATFFASDTTGKLILKPQAAATILGNATAGVASPIPLTGAQVAALLPNQPARGTWTPTVSCVTPGDLTVVMGTTTGNYRLAAGGDMVDVDFVVTFTPTYTTASGFFEISGLPFPVQARSSGGLLHFGSSSAFTWTTSATMLNWQALNNTSKLRLLTHRTGAISAQAQITQFVSGTTVTLRGQGSYPLI